MKKWFHSLHVIVVIAVSLAFYYFFLQKIDFTNLKTALLNYPAHLLAVGFCFYLFTPIFRAVRLDILASAHERPISFATALKIALMGSFFGSFGTLIGADGSKVAALRRATGEGAKAAAIVTTDRLMGMIALIVYMMGMLFLCHGALSDFGLTEGQILIPLAFMAGGLLVFLLFLAGIWMVLRLVVQDETRQTNPILRRLEVFLPGVLEHRGRYGTLAVVFLLSLLELLNYFVYCRVLLWDTDVPGLAIGIITVVELFIFSIPITLQGLGVMEATMTVMLLALGLDEGRAVAVPLVLRVLTLSSALFGAFVFFRWGKEFFEKKRSAEDAP